MKIEEGKKSSYLKQPSYLASPREDPGGEGGEDAAKVPEEEEGAAGVVELMPAQMAEGATSSDEDELYQFDCTNGIVSGAESTFTTETETDPTPSAEESWIPSAEGSWIPSAEGSWYTNGIIPGSGIIPATDTDVSGTGADGSWF